MSFDPNTVVTQGGVKKTDVTDATTHELLIRILDELKILNMHQSIATDTEYTVNDINK